MEQQGCHYGKVRYINELEVLFLDMHTVFVSMTFKQHSIR